VPDDARSNIIRSNDDHEESRGDNPHMFKSLLSMLFPPSRLFVRASAVWAIVAIPVPPAAAEEAATSCACQSALVCGADSCDPADASYCTSSSISFQLDPPAINFCIGEDCMSGPAAVSRPRDQEIWLHGSFSHTAAPDQNPTSVTLLLDKETGIGLIQASDEQGVDQVSVICEISSEE